MGTWHEVRNFAWHRPLRLLKQPAKNCFSGDVIPGRCSLLVENFCFLQSFKTKQRSFLLLFCLFYRYANVPFHFHLFPRKSVNHVMNQSKQQTLSIYAVSQRFRFRTSFSKHSLAMYPFSISLYEHVSLKFLMTKKTEANKQTIFTNISIYWFWKFLRM